MRFDDRECPQKLQMKRPLLIGIPLVLILNIPTTFVVAIVLLPLWSWIETRYKIESVGHSGPSDWCFNVTYVAVCLVELLAIAAARKMRAPP